MGQCGVGRPAHNKEILAKQGAVAGLLTEPLRLTGTVSWLARMRLRGGRPAVEGLCGVGRPAHNRGQSCAGSGDPRTTKGRLQVQLIPDRCTSHVCCASVSYQSADE
jgi:hypothetical protein